MRSRPALISTIPSMPTSLSSSWRLRYGKWRDLRSFRPGILRLRLSPGSDSEQWNIWKCEAREGRAGISAGYTLGYLDVQTADTVRVGVNGYQIPWLHVNRNDVATTYSYDLVSLAGLLSAAQSMTTPHASATLLSSLSGGSFTGSSAAMSSRSLVNVCCFEFGVIFYWQCSQNH